MAKKFGKLLLFSAAVGSAIGAVYYFARKKSAEQDSAEEDYDDFSDEEEKKDCDSRSYVPLTPEGEAGETEAAAEPDEAGETEATAGSDETAEAETAAEPETATAAAPAEETAGFTPLADEVAKTVQNAEETVEEFFDEEDGPDEEPPITDN